MKRLPLKVLPDPNTAGGPDIVDYRQVITAVVRRPLDPQRGVDIEEMRRGIRILDAVDAATGTVLELDDADWEHLVQKLNVMPWAMVDRRVMQFINDMTNPPDVGTLNHVWTEAAAEVG